MGLRELNVWSKVSTPYWKLASLWSDNTDHSRRIHWLIVCVVAFCSLALLFLLLRSEGRAALFVFGLLSVILVLYKPELALVGIVLWEPGGGREIFMRVSFAAAGLPKSFNSLVPLALVLFSIWLHAGLYYVKLPKAERPRIFSPLIIILGAYCAWFWVQYVRGMYYDGNLIQDLYDFAPGAFMIFVAIPAIILLHDLKKLRLFVFGVAVIAAFNLVTITLDYLGVLPQIIANYMGLGKREFEDTGTRVWHPATQFVYFMTFLSISYLGLTRSLSGLLGWTWLFACVPSVIALKQRNAWLSILAFAPVIFMLKPNDAKLRALPAGIFFMLIFSALLLNPEIKSKFDNKALEVQKRFEASFDPREYQSGGIAIRRTEIEEGIPTWQKNNQWIGIGIRTPYMNEYQKDYRQQAKRNVLVPKFYMHNSYVWHLMKTGIVGAVLLFALISVFFWRWFQIYPKTDRFERAFLLGFMGYMLLSLVAGMVQPQFTWSEGIFVYPLGYAGMEVIANRIRQREREGINASESPEETRPPLAPTAVL